MAIEIPNIQLSTSERNEVAEILTRRSNEIASFAQVYTAKPEHFGSVEMALTREMARLRKLADKIKPPKEESDDE